MTAAYGSADVRRLLDDWAGRAAKLDRFDELQKRYERLVYPEQLEQEVLRENDALDGYKEAVHHADEAIREQVRRELQATGVASS